MNKFLTLLACSLMTFHSASSLFAQGRDEFENPPINYSAGVPENVVSVLEQKVQDDEVRLKFNVDDGFLKSLLKELKIPESSQVLVFSKTSLQMAKIGPKTPRAIYFNDDVYVGYALNGDVIEISVNDPKLGLVFYTLDQEETDRPRLHRETDRCLTCHSSSRTENVPGHLVRSIIVDPRGLPVYSAGSRNVDYRTPFFERWGGWYVTGTHGEQLHQGNFISKNRSGVSPVDNSEGQNVLTLEGKFPVEKYLTPHSDIVALMMLEHQVLVHNRITKATFATQQALHYRQVMTESLGEESQNVEESVQRRIERAGDELLEALLMVDEAALHGQITGTSSFADEFQKLGPFDSRGRTLRQLDLKTRMFKFPCSYLIYTDVFKKLPQECTEYVWQRLFEILTTDEPDRKYSHLSQADRSAVLEILVETVDEIPQQFRDYVASKADTAR